MVGLAKQASASMMKRNGACFLSVALKKPARYRQTGMHGDTQTHVFTHKHTCVHARTLFVLLLLSYKAKD